MGAACTWQIPGGCTDWRYHLGPNKKAFDAEVYAIYQALDILDQRQESGRQYTVFVDSTAAIDRIRSGSGQSPAIACIKVCTRLESRGGEVTVRWVPAHHGVPGNEVANEYARSSAKGTRNSNVPNEHRWETSLSHMSRVATETKAKTTEESISAHARVGRGYRPPRGKGVRRKQPRRARKSLAGRCY